MCTDSITRSAGRPIGTFGTHGRTVRPCQRARGLRSLRPYDVPVSVRVDLESLPAEIARAGATAFVVTVSAEGPPHVASVIVTLEGDHLSMGAGRTTRGYAAARPAVTLIWAVAHGGEYCLIVDGEAREEPMEKINVWPTSAVLHRLATPETGEGAGS